LGELKPGIAEVLEKLEEERMDGVGLERSHGDG
jgi:hypothetical protein